MFCPQCGKSLPAPAAFCMHCGADLRQLTQGQPVQPQPQPQPQPFQQPQPPISRSGPQMPSGRPVAAVDAAFAQAQTKKRNIAIAAGAGALVLALLIGAIATNFLNRTATQPAETVLQRQAKPPEPVLDKTAAPPAPVMEKEATAPKVMPDDVRRWLEHLEETEKRRGKLAMQGLGTMMQLAPAAQMGIDLDALKALASGDPDQPEPKTGADKVAEGAAQVKQEWDALKEYFKSVYPPQECLATANTYWNALDETAAMIQDILGAVVKSKENTSAALDMLYGMQNTSKTIDAAGTQTDGLVQQICDKYDTKKWFSINSDFAQSGLFGKMGG